MIIHDLSNLVLKFADDGPRRCGGCTLCCKLIPVRELNKQAGERCQHQRTGKGCAVHHQPGMPRSCLIWNCRWLGNPAETAELRRPDRSHYCIDILPDFVTLVDNNTGERTNIEVVQVWIDPKYPDAHKDPALRRYLDRRGEGGIAAIVRYDSLKAFTLFPPSMTDGTWREYHHGTVEAERTPQERFAGIASARKIKF